MFSPPPPRPPRRPRPRAPLSTPRRAPRPIWLAHTVNLLQYVSEVELWLTERGSIPQPLSKAFQLMPTLNMGVVALHQENCSTELLGFFLSLLLGDQVEPGWKTSDVKSCLTSPLSHPSRCFSSQSSSPATNQFSPATLKSGKVRF